MSCFLFCFGISVASFSFHCPCLIILFIDVVYSLIIFVVGSDNTAVIQNREPIYYY